MDRKSKIWIIVGCLIVVCIILITASLIYYYSYVIVGCKECEESSPNIVFVMYKENGHLIVDSTGGETDYLWSDINLSFYGEGTATLPVDDMYISPGDVLTNCTGKINVVWTPTGTLIGTYDFS